MFSNNLLMAAASASGAGGYEVENSVRLNDDDSANMTKTFAGAGTTTTWTYSTWVKRGNLGITAGIFTGDAPVGTDGLIFDTNDKIQWYAELTGAWSELLTTQVFRDPTAWLNIVAVYDSTNATSGDRLRLYVNGVRITDFAAEVYPTQNDPTLGINTTRTQYMMSSAGGSFFDGYFAQNCFIDGQALTSDSFGEFDDEGAWRPIAIEPTTLDFLRKNPYMTSNTAPHGDASASTEFSASYQAWEAFGGGGTSEYWSSTNDSGVGWLQYHFDTAQIITKYDIQSENIGNTPTDWTLEASNTGSYGGEEVTLDTQSSLSWSSQETKEFTFTNSTAYSYYRLVITGTDNMTYLEVNSFGLYTEPTNGFGTNGFLLDFAVAPGTGMGAGTDTSQAAVPAAP